MTTNLSANKIRCSFKFYKFTIKYYRFKFYIYLGNLSEIDNNIMHMEQMSRSIDFNKIILIYVHMYTHKYK